MQLTVYSNSFDDYSYVANGGMNNKVFVEGNGKGKEFKNVSQALDYIIAYRVPVDTLVYKFQRGGVQYYQKFDFKLPSQQKNVQNSK